jgi:hypothetical protein
MKLLLPAAIITQPLDLRRRNKVLEKCSTCNVAKELKNMLGLHILGSFAALASLNGTCKFRGQVAVNEEAADPNTSGLPKLEWID